MPPDPITTHAIERCLQRYKYALAKGDGADLMQQIVQGRSQVKRVVVGSNKLRSHEEHQVILPNGTPAIVLVDEGRKVIVTFLKIKTFQKSGTPKKAWRDKDGAGRREVQTFLRVRGELCDGWDSGEGRAMSRAEILGEVKREGIGQKKLKKKSKWGAPFVCNIAAYRARNGLSIDDVAKAVGMSRTGLWQVEQGADPMLSTALKISVFFDRSISELWSKR